MRKSGYSVNTSSQAGQMFHIMMWRQGCDLAILAIVYPPCSITIYRVHELQVTRDAGVKTIW